MNINTEKSYREAHKRFSDNETFRQRAKLKIKELQGEVDKNDPALIKHLESFRACMVAGLLMKYWEMGIKIPISSVVGQTCVESLPPITEDEVICGLIALKQPKELIG